MPAQSVGIIEIGFSEAAFLDGLRRAGGVLLRECAVTQVVLDRLPAGRRPADSLAEIFAELQRERWFAEEGSSAPSDEARAHFYGGA